MLCVIESEATSKGTWRVRTRVNGGMQGGSDPHAGQRHETFVSHGKDESSSVYCILYLRYAFDRIWKLLICFR